MIRLLEWLGRYGAWALFGGVFIGLAVPPLATLFRPLLVPSVIFVLMFSLLRVQWRVISEYARRPWLAAGLCLWLMVICPLLVWMCLSLADLPKELRMAIVMMAAAPPLLSATALALLLGLDAALSILVTLLATLIAPITFPVVVLLLLDVEMEGAAITMTAQLTAIIAAACLGAFLLRVIAKPERLMAQSRAIDGIIVILLLVFAVAIMDGVARTLVQEPGKVALWLAAAFIANPLLQVLGSAVFLRLGRQAALTVGLMTGNCNMGLILAALPADSPPDIALFFALGQLPMYLLPALAMPIYRRLLRQ